MTAIETERALIRIEESGSSFSLDPLLEFVRDPRNGGVATFTGTVRSVNEDREVDHLEYECYEPMAKQELRDILEEAQHRWNDRGPLRLAAAHRVGDVGVGEPSVMVAVSAPHRAEALEACRYVIDELKARVAIWKKEYFEDGDVWVENKESIPDGAGDE